MKSTIYKMKSIRDIVMSSCTLAAVLLSSCNAEELIESNVNDLSVNDGLELNVTKSDFFDHEGNSSRVANDGIKTSFEDGDVIGVLVTHNEEKLNLPYKMENGIWVFDYSKGKDFFVKTQPGELSYIVYYPYSDLADGKSTKDELLQVLSIKDDQSSKENYTSSDVLYAEVKSENKQVTANLQHAYSLMSLTFNVKFKTTLPESSELQYSYNDLDIKLFGADNKELKLYKSSDGEYRYIIPSGVESYNLTWFYKFDGKLYTSKKSFSQPKANNKYSITELINSGVYNESKAQVGDYYCTSSDNKGYLLPKAYKISSSEHKCIGIVFHTGVGTGDSKDYYVGTAIETNGINGYVVALNDANESSGIWGPRVTVNGIESSQSYVYSYVGYKNTNIVKGLQAYVDAETGLPMKDNTHWAFKAAAEYSVEAPLSTSGWYLPSIGQLTDIGKISDLEKIFTSVNGDAFRTDLQPNSYGAVGGYWSSSENKDSDAWYFCFKDKTQKSWSKSQEYAAPSYVRAVLTF